VKCRARFTDDFIWPHICGRKKNHKGYHKCGLETTPEKKCLVQWPQKKKKKING